MLIRYLEQRYIYPDSGRLFGFREWILASTRSTSQPGLHYGISANNPKSFASFTHDRTFSFWSKAQRIA